MFAACKSLSSSRKRHLSVRQLRRWDHCPLLLVADVFTPEKRHVQPLSNDNCSSQVFRLSNHDRGFCERLKNSRAKTGLGRTTTEHCRDRATDDVVGVALSAHGCARTPSLNTGTFYTARVFPSVILRIACILLIFSL